MFADARIDTIGPFKIDKQILKALKSLGAEIAQLSLDDISVRVPKAALIKDLKRALANQPKESVVRHSGYVGDGMMIEDSYVYRLKR